MMGRLLTPTISKYKWESCHSHTQPLPAPGICVPLGVMYLWHIWGWYRRLPVCVPPHHGMAARPGDKVPVSSIFRRG